MKRIACVAVLMFAVACLVAPVAEAGGGFSVRDVDGQFAFAFDGFVTFGALVPVAAVGRFIADGRGNITDGVRTLVVGGIAVKQTFTCTYTVNPDGTGSAACEIAGASDESFDFVIVDKKKEVFFTATTPGVTLRGAVKRQH